MNKLRVIDLLNKIANGDEVQQFKYCGGTYRKSKKDNKYWCNGMWFDFDIDVLNDEVEIIEEEKKIPEKLDYCEENTFMIKCKENSYLTREEIRLLDSNFKELGNKINEVLDYLKSKGE